LPKADKERGKHQLFETVHYHHLINKTPATSFLIDFCEKICFLRNPQPYAANVNFRNIWRERITVLMILHFLLLFQFCRSLRDIPLSGRILGKSEVIITFG